MKHERFTLKTFMLTAQVNGTLDLITLDPMTLRSLILYTLLMASHAITEMLRSY